MIRIITPCKQYLSFPLRQILGIQRSCSFPQCHSNLFCRCQYCQTGPHWYLSMPHGPCCWEAQCFLQVPTSWKRRKNNYDYLCWNTVSVYGLLQVVTVRTEIHIRWTHIETLHQFVLQPGGYFVNNVILLIWISMEIVQLKWSWDGEGWASSTVLYVQLRKTANFVFFKKIWISTWKFRSLKGPQRIAPTSVPTTGGTFWKLYGPSQSGQEALH